MITQIIQKLFFCVTDARVAEKLFPRQLMCIIGAFAANYTKELLPESPV